MARASNYRGPLGDYLRGNGSVARVLARTPNSPVVSVEAVGRDHASYTLGSDRRVVVSAAVKYLEQAGFTGVRVDHDAQRGLPCVIGRLPHE